MSYETFKKDSMLFINMTKGLLDEHRGFKELFANIALCILGLGIGYLAVCLYKNSIFRFNTDTGNKLDAFPKIIESIAPTVAV